MITKVNQVAAGLHALDLDIIDGVENDAVEKIPGWKLKMVSLRIK
jgi:hypothetical protein